MNVVTEEEVRLLVREAIARHTARQEPPEPPAVAFERQHASFMLFSLARGQDASDCLIEPASRCSHCGYCKTYGH